MPDIFISYRRGDTAGHAGRLYDGLLARFPDSRVFMDVDAIEPGIDFVERIQEAVRACEVAIVLIGDEWLDVADREGRRRLDDPNDFIRVEVATALDAGVKVIPVLVEGSAMPPVEDLPEDIRPLARRNAIELSDARWHYDAGRLLDAVHGPGPAGEPAASQRAPETPARPRWRPPLGRLVMAFALVAAVIVALVLVSGGGDESGPPGPVQVTRGPVVALAAGQGAVWAVDRDAGTLLKLDPDSGKPEGKPIPVGGQPSALAVGQNAVWVLSQADRSVLRFDPRTGQAGTPAPLGGFSESVAAGAGAVWAAINDERSGVLRIDPVTSKAGAFIRTPPISHVATGDFSELAATAKGDALFIDPTALRVARRVRLGGAGELAFDDRGGLWVAGNGIARLSADGSGELRRLALPTGGPFALAVGGGAVWAADFDNAMLYRADPERVVLTGKPIALDPRATSLAAGQEAVYVGYSDGRVQRIRIDSVD